jgi:hypothetical protein
MSSLYGRLLAVTILAALFSLGAYGAEALDAQPAAEATAGDAAQLDPVDGETAAPAEGVAEEPVRIQMAVYSWMPGIKNSVESNGDEATSDVPFSKIFDALDFANFAHLEIQKGKWGIFSELDFVKLSENGEFRTPRRGLPFKTNADFAIKQTMVELGGIRSFDGERVGFDALAGARYFRMDSKVHVGPFGSDVTKDWVDPLIGGRLRFQLSDRWQAALRADLAGFGVGSELTTNIVATIGYKLSERNSLAFGYRYMDIDYEKDDVEVGMTTSGPIIGMVFRF